MVRFSFVRHSESTVDVMSETLEEADSEESSKEIVAVDEPLVLVKQVTNDNAYSEYYYDESGRITQELTYFKGEQSNCYVYTYNEKEDGTTLLRIMNDVPAGIGHERIYDEAGNCIKDISYFSGNTDPEKMFDESFIQGTNVYEYDENNV